MFRRSIPTHLRDLPLTFLWHLFYLLFHDISWCRCSKVGRPVPTHLGTHKIFWSYFRFVSPATPNVFLFSCSLHLPFVLCLPHEMANRLFCRAHSGTTCWFSAREINVSWQMKKWMLPCVGSKEKCSASQDSLFVCATVREITTQTKEKHTCELIMVLTCATLCAPLQRAGPLFQHLLFWHFVRNFPDICSTFFLVCTAASLFPSILNNFPKHFATIFILGFMPVYF